MTSIAVGDIAPVRHGEAMSLAAAEYGRFTDLLVGLSPDDWARPTACEPCPASHRAAGTTFVNGTGGEAMEIDAGEWIWTISGRAPGTGLLARALAL